MIGQGGVDLAVLGVGAVAALVQGDRLLVRRVLAQGPEGRALAPRRGLGDQDHGAVQADGQDVVVLGQGLVGRLVLHVGAVAADAGQDRLAGLGVRSDLARQGEQRQGRLEVDLHRAHALGQRAALRLFGALLLGGLAQLQVDPEGPLADRDRQAARRVRAQQARAGQAGLGLGVLAVDHRQRAGVAAVRVVGAADEAAGLADLQAQAAFLAGRAGPRVVTGLVRIDREEVRAQLGVQRLDDVGDPQVLGLVDRGLEAGPEVLQQLLPGQPPVRDRVELAFEVGGEAVFNVAGEEAAEEGGDHAAAILGVEAPLLQPDVVAVLQDLQDRGVGRGPADAQLLQLLDQAGLGEARRRLGEVLLGQDLAAGHRLALVHRRQAAVAVLALARAVVAALLIERQVAVEGDHRAGRPQLGRGAVDGDVDRDLVQAGAFHLAGQGAFPDQLVESELVRAQPGREVRGPAGDVGRADRLVRLLGVAGLGLVDPGRLRQVGLPEAFDDGVADSADGLVGDLHAVGPHVGDQADHLAAQVDALVELLCGAHGPGRAEAELARGLLLQGRGGEGRRRVAADLLALDLLDLEGPGLLQPAGGRHGAGLVAEVELFELLALQVAQPRGEERAGPVGQLDVDGPELPRLEDLDLGLALADQPQGDRLHAAGRAAARQLAPQHRRQGEADQVVQGAPRQVGVDQLAVQVARMLEGVEHGVLGDLVEDHAADLDPAQGLAPAQLLGDVPGDRLALAIRVGGEVEPGGPPDGVGDLLQPLLRAVVHLPVHGEVFVRPHRAVLGRQVAHVAIAGQHLEGAAQVLVDRLRLGRRFDDHDALARVCPGGIRHALTIRAPSLGHARDQPVSSPSTESDTRFPGCRTTRPASSSSKRTRLTIAADNWA